jgi:hypothetical protein
MFTFFAAVFQQVIIIVWRYSEFALTEGKHANDLREHVFKSSLFAGKI